MINNLQKQTIIFIGAHYDDIELSCGGLISDIIENNNIIFIIATKSSSFKENFIRKREQKKSLELLNIQTYYLLNNKDGAIINNKKTFNQFEQIILKIKPNYIFTHFPNDTHQDHRIVSEIITSICYRQKINLYYFNSFSAINFEYNIIYTIQNIKKKIQLLKIFKSQIYKNYNNKLNFLNKELIKNYYFGLLYNKEFVELYLLKIFYT